jgi:hypothetical protein
MKIKSYIWGIRLMTLFSLIVLGTVIFFVDPSPSNLISFLIFYSVAFLFLSGLFNLFLISLRKIFLGGEISPENVELSFRQGILLALIALLILFFQGIGILVWWNALLVVAGVFLIEFYFLSRD